MEIDFSDPLEKENSNHLTPPVAPKDKEAQIKEALKKLQEHREGSISNETTTKNAEFTPFEFRANAKEYFKIWIVNIALTIITLGIYSAWAKVRTNRYLYASTYLNNSNFEYNANPKRILIGRVIVVGFYGLFYLFSDILGLYKIALGIAVLFLLLLPWLIRQAIRFRLKSTSYRNINFSYRGKTWSFYKLALLGIFLLVIYFGASYFLSLILGRSFGGFSSSLLFSFIIIPLLYREYKHLVINNSYYGTSQFSFDATKKDTIVVFVSIALITFVFFLIFGVAVWLGSLLLQNAVGKAFSGDIAKIIISIVFALIFALAIGFYKGLADGFFSNFTRDNTKLGSAHFKGEIEPVSLGFISATNSVAIIASLGLLFPWARVRYLKYKFEHTLFACTDYDKFIADEKDNISTVGEEAMDFFDIDIGV